MRTLLSILLISLLSPAAVALAQDVPAVAPVAIQANPFSAATQMMYAALMEFLFFSPETSPEKNDSFKLGDLVRPFGKILGNIAGAQFTACPAEREKNRVARVARTNAPPELIAAFRRG